VPGRPARSGTRASADSTAAVVRSPSPTIALTSISGTAAVWYSRFRSRTAPAQAGNSGNQRASVSSTSNAPSRTSSAAQPAVICLDNDAAYARVSGLAGCPAPVTP